jgi:hypothetical protein
MNAIEGILDKISLDPPLTDAECQKLASDILSFEEGDMPFEEAVLLVLKSAILRRAWGYGEPRTCASGKNGRTPDDGLMEDG